MILGLIWDWLFHPATYKVRCIECGRTSRTEGQHVEDFYFCNAQCAKAYDVRVVAALKVDP